MSNSEANISFPYDSPLYIYNNSDIYACTKLLAKGLLHPRFDRVLQGFHNSERNMFCKQCRQTKLRREFPFETLTDECNHAPLHCLRVS